MVSNKSNHPNTVAGQAEPASGRREKLPYGRAREELLRKAVTRDRVPHQRMGVVAGAVVTEVNYLFWSGQRNHHGLL
jgi:hypothetical protein